MSEVPQRKWRESRISQGVKQYRRGMKRDGTICGDEVRQRYEKRQGLTDEAE